MKRIYDVPPSYGGSRFIRATHGVRALADGEVPGDVRHSSPRAKNDRRGREQGPPRPDFEYYGNAIGAPGGASGGSAMESARMGEVRQTPPGTKSASRYGPDEAYRGDPSPVDRYGHDLGVSRQSLVSPADQTDPEQDSGDAALPDYGDPKGQKVRWRRAARLRPSGKGAALCGRRAATGGDKRHGGAHGRDGNGRGEHRGDSPFGLSADDGDLLLLALLALLAGEDGCADVAAALALLLAVR